MGALEDEIRANQYLQSQGSVMARPQQPEWRRNLSPLAGTLLDMIDKVLSFGPSPLDAAGGGAKGLEAVLGPIRTAAEKKIVGSLAKNAPNLLSQVQRMPNQVTFKAATPWSNPMASGVMEGGQIIPNMQISINPAVLRGRLPEAVRKAYPEYAGLTGKESIFANTPGVVGHEAQHAVDAAAKEFRGMKPTEQLDLASSVVKGFKGAPDASGLDQIRMALQQDERLGADEALAYLRQHQLARTPVLKDLADATFGAEVRPYDELVEMLK